MNFSNPDLLINPYPHYKRWREEHPIWWAEDIKGWVLSRYDDVRFILKDAKTFSSNSMGEMDQQAMALPLLTDDPPRHTQLRAIVNKAFTSSTLKDMEVEVASLVDELLDDMVGKTHIDISSDFKTKFVPSLYILLSSSFTSAQLPAPFI